MYEWLAGQAIVVYIIETIHIYIVSNKNFIGKGYVTRNNIRDYTHHCERLRNDYER